MKQYPIFLNLRRKKAVVFGAGKVALRKIKGLLEAGAFVEVTSREFSKEIKALSQKEPRLKLKPRAPIPVFLKEASLAFIATSDADYNKRIVRECRRRKILVNAADQPESSDFFVPSHFRKGKLEVAISTGGASPLLAKKFREELSLKLRPKALRLLNQMGRLRGQARSQFSSQKKRRDFFKEKLGDGFHFLKNGGDSK